MELPIKQQNGILTAVEHLGLVHVDRQMYDCLKCVCQCGNNRIVKTYQFFTEHVKSCGCLAIKHKKQFVIEYRPKRHIGFGHPLYVTWLGMIARCYNPKNPSYNSYGGRGIRVCEEWRSNVLCFYEWAECSGYKDGLSLDRHPDNDGNYEPNNCRWATPEMQCNNRRSSRYVELNGIKYTMADACRELKLSYKIINQRVQRDGLSFEEAISKPFRKSPTKHK